MALVQLSQCTWYLVMARVFFQGSVENLAAMRLNVLFMFHAKLISFSLSVIDITFPSSFGLPPFLLE